VRFARTEASQYRGNSGTVTLVGHSLGGWVGSVVALDPTEFQGGCLADGSGRPDAFVGLSGNYQISSGENAADLNAFFGGSAAATAKSRAASDPFNYAGGSAVPIRLVAGTDDETVDPAQSKALDAYLVKRGWDVSLTMVDGGGHMTIIATQSTYDAVFSALSAASSSVKAIPTGLAR
jgi:pimeloyl-ACP methyl ester carboxylesterase